ncbi:MAG: hypothetical protein Q9174_003929, partial [Haloplaca sp. 1 TL-2023]
MRLKVLYTFDHDNKTNCLARWPQNIDIRTAYLDQNTQIGVIELKTCIQAIVAASPELVAKLGQDYTVYAYDYSEYDTPLVGQGMLSWVLASASPNPGAPAHQSRTIVTGRVCKNIMGLFSQNAEETLEVKLRLVPVPTCLQSEYIESMKSYRELSRVMPPGFDAQAWTNFLQANPGITQLVTQSRSGSPAVPGGPRVEAGIGHVQRLMQQGHAPAGRSDNNAGLQSNNYSAAEAIEQLPRPPSQASSVHSTAPPKRPRGRPPKPFSELTQATRNRKKVQQSRRASVDVEYGSNDEQQEEVPTKKRAKVTKTDYTGSSDFGKQPELRVAASAAASLRMHQPTAVRPSAQAARSLEGPPRAPTPVAEPHNPSLRPLLHARKSNLGREPLVVEDPPYESPYPASDVGKPPESDTYSPEGSQADSANTPADFNSSPPVFPISMTAHSSPQLPRIPREIDSGFMSENIDDLFEDEECRPLDAEDLDVAAQYMKRPNLGVPPSSMIGGHDSGIVPHSDEAHDQPPAGPANGANQIPATSDPSRSALNRTASSGDLATLTDHNHGTVRPSLLHRSQTWAGQHDHPSSEIHATSDADVSTSVPRSRKIRSGSGTKRKERIKSQLATSVANGEMPPFCENCGAIETPTWRKAWFKVHSGTPEHVVISEEPGGIIAWQTLQTDVNGQICLFRIIKKTVLPTDEGFTESLLCNPCGIWLHTRKCMRPKEAWDSHQGPGSGGSRKRAPQSQKDKTNSFLTQATSDRASGGTAFSSDGSSPMDATDQHQESEPSQLRAQTRPRASSLHDGEPAHTREQMKESTAAAALQRAIQSSPVHQRSFQHISTTEEDLTPKPMRRILFPSPSQKEQNQRSSSQASGGTQRSENLFDERNSDEVDSANKENVPPPSENDEPDDPNDEPPPRSLTPTPSSKSNHKVFKTPKRCITPDPPQPSTGDFFSSAARALLRPRTTPKHTSNRHSEPAPLSDVSPFTAHINAILSDVNNVSPTHSNFDFPALPSLSNTPGRVHPDFDFSQFDPQDALSTDVPMASSPPLGGWFGVYEDPAEKDTDWWTQYGFLGSSPPKVPMEKSKAKAAALT